MTRSSIVGMRYAPWFAAACAALVIASGWTPAYGTGIQGTMSNFDVFNETAGPVWGAEIELEGCHSGEVTRTYPAHFNSITQSEYSSGTTYGTRIRFSGYNFDPSGYLIPRQGFNTNGHYAVNQPGCEHFGFAVRAQPTTTRFFWLNQGLARIGNMPLSIPNATWTYVPPAVPGNPGVMQAVVVPPVPEIPEAMLPDSIWMKIYVTELSRPVQLQELISAPPGAPDSVAPQLPSEIEREWVLLEGGVPEQSDSQVDPGAESVVRRYEYYKYTGAYDPTDHAPLSAGLDPSGNPYPNELGEFIAANMVAANLNCPLPGDMNGDGQRNGTDLHVFVTCLVGSGADCSCADMNADGILNAADVSALVSALLS